jgi:1A family penicillin-binding protein
MKKFRRIFWTNRRWWQRILLVMGLLLIVLGGFLYWWLLADLPDVDAIEAGIMLPSTRIYDRNGRLLYEIVDLYEGSHANISLSDLPSCMANATVATEDANFYSHPGVDMEGIIRAIWVNIRGGEIRAGGSTITQQVARNLLLKDEMSERSLRRKLREMILAVELNRQYSRDEILELYLNQTYYGNLAYGVEAASMSYFGHSARNLSLAQCALLAGLPQTPAEYNPLTNLDAAKERQKVVLGLMVKQGYITQAEADIAQSEELHFAASTFPIRAPHFVAAVWTQLERDYAEALYSGGLEVTTTVDLSWQEEAERIVRQQLDDLNNPPDGSPPKNAHNAALVAIDPFTGQILTMLGSPDYFDESIDGNVNAALAHRQPGSALKPFTYAAAFDPARPDPWTPATMILDVGTPFVTKKLESYAPSNFGLAEHGPVLIREALAGSYNIPAVVTLEHIGLDALIRLTTRLGISTLTDSSRFDLSLTLGGGEIKLLDLTAAYAAFPNGGQRIDPVYILEVKDHEGNILYEWKPPSLGMPELDPRVAYLITSILSDDNARYPSFGRGSALSLGARPSAAKTGTTTDFRDNWTIGYTPNLVVGVWVGNADNTPMRDVTGVSGAGPIWNQFMRTVLHGQPYLNFDVPDGLERVQVCAMSGLLPTPECPQYIWEWFIEGTAPTEPDNLYQKFVIDERTGNLADENTPEEFRHEEIFLVLPPEARTWAAQNGIPMPPIGAQLVGYENYPVKLLAPDPYTVFQLTPHTPLETQRIRLVVAAPSDTESVSYFLDGMLIATAQTEPFEVWWQLLPGAHQLQAVVRTASDEYIPSQPVPFRVNSWVPPEARPIQGPAE